jgi:hypothetical protein
MRKLVIGVAGFRLPASGFWILDSGSWIPYSRFFFLVFPGMDDLTGLFSLIILA